MPANVYNANWLASNLVRKYPLDSLASCIDKDGKYFPDEFITDIQVVYPADLGEYCYVSAANITANIVSLVLSVDRTPIASLCVSKNEYKFRSGMYHIMESLYDGVRALVTLGCDKSSVIGSWSFTDPLSSRILPTCCTPYVRPTVLSLSRPDDSTPLYGNVLLTGGGDIKLDVDTITIEDKPTKVIFIGLDLSVDPKTVLKKYITKCDVSTSMNSCSMPYIESIGGALPDCSGNIVIESGSNHVNVTTSDGKIYISTDIKLADICSKFDGIPPENSDSSAATKCPYPSVISDNICNAKQGYNIIDYGFDGTDVDLYSNDVMLSSGSAAGLLYGDNPDKPGSITSTSNDIPVSFDVKVKPESTVAVAVSFSELTSAGIPKGSLQINIGNDKVFIDQGNLTVKCDAGIGDDSKSFGNSDLVGADKAIIIFSGNTLSLKTDYGTKVLASLDDGLSGYGTDGYDLHIQLRDKVYLDGVRYV